LAITAAGGTAWDEANEPISADVTSSEIKTASTQIPILDKDADLGSTGDGSGPIPPGNWSLPVDPPLALGDGESVAGAGDSPARAANSDRQNARAPNTWMAHHLKGGFCEEVTDESHFSRST
jgi:hypothetical protein